MQKGSGCNFERKMDYHPDSSVIDLTRITLATRNWREKVVAGVKHAWASSELTDLQIINDSTIEEGWTEVGSRKRTYDTSDSDPARPPRELRMKGTERGPERTSDSGETGTRRPSQRARPILFSPIEFNVDTHLVSSGSAAGTVRFEGSGRPAKGSLYLGMGTLQAASQSPDGKSLVAVPVV